MTLYLIWQFKTNSIAVLKELYRRSAPFLGLYIMVLIPVLFILTYFGKGQIHLFVNAHHSPFLDHFFLYVTKLGEPLIVCAVMLGLLFLKFRYSIILGLSTGIGATISAIIKASITDDMRPFKFFQYYNAPLHFVEGLKLPSFNTFPSGHTTLAFSFFFLLSIFLKKPWLSVLLFILAVLVAYSRMYLSMHFLIDVCAGSILGLVTAGCMYLLVTLNPRFTRRKWWDKKLERKRRSVK